jgi:hypothetical protein
VRKDSDESSSDAGDDDDEKKVNDDSKELMDVDLSMSQSVSEYEEIEKETIDKDGKKVKVKIKRKKTVGKALRFWAKLKLGLQKIEKGEPLFPRKKKDGKKDFWGLLHKRMFGKDLLAKMKAKKIRDKMRKKQEEGK